MALVSITCDQCGGAVAMQAGAPCPQCLFCGAPRPTPRAPTETIPLPESVLPFALDGAAAQAAFQAWANKRFWAPDAVRQARVELHALLLPAWVWSARMVGHYAAIVPDRSTRSNKRPQTGQTDEPIRNVLVPSSASIRQAELAAISPFDLAPARRFDATRAEAPFELGQLTRHAARQHATEAMQRSLEQSLGRSLQAEQTRVAVRFHEVRGRSLFLPVWIGAYRVDDTSYRVVLNGQSGRLAGTAPVSWLKVLAAVSLTAFVLLAVALVLSRL